MSHTLIPVVLLIGLMTLTACGGSPAQVGRSNFGPMSCPNLSPLSQQYMQGKPVIPVRCSKQAEPYF